MVKQGGIGVALARLLLQKSMSAVRFPVIGWHIESSTLIVNIQPQDRFDQFI